jgi:hypothetical protein
MRHRCKKGWDKGVNVVTTGIVRHDENDVSNLSPSYLIIFMKKMDLYLNP